MDVAERQGHRALVEMMQRAIQRGPWAPPTSPEIRASSNAWQEAEPRRTPLGFRVAYAQAVIDVPPRSRYYVDSFERILVGWHGTFNPPCGMGGEPCINLAKMAARIAGTLA